MNREVTLAKCPVCNPMVNMVRRLFDMTERERLIELLDECRGIEGIGMELVEKHADLLLANGVIVPPCKVGDWVYVDVNTFFPTFIYYEHEFIYSKYFVIGEIVSIVKTKKQLLMKIRVLTKNHRQYAQKRYTVNAIGKTIFFTREGAIKALSEKE